jgi:hypothetical protein
MSFPFLAPCAGFPFLAIPSKTGRSPCWCRRGDGGDGLRARAGAAPPGRDVGRHRDPLDDLVVKMLSRTYLLFIVAFGVYFGSTFLDLGRARELFVSRMGWRPC